MTFLDPNGAYGGSKAGAPFNLQEYIERPPVIYRAVCWLFCVIVMGCISSKGWYINKENGKEYCVYNNDTNACNYAVGISVIAFVASIMFLVGEYMFEKTSSAKLRKRYLVVDICFSVCFTLVFFVAFVYLDHAWKKTLEPPVGTAYYLTGAIFFSFASTFPWFICGVYAGMRLHMGPDGAFLRWYDAEESVSSSESCTEYSIVPDTQLLFYSESPLIQKNNGNFDYTAPTY